MFSRHVEAGSGFSLISSKLKITFFFMFGEERRSKSNNLRLKTNEKVFLAAYFSIFNHFYYKTKEKKQEIVFFLCS